MAFSFEIEPEAVRRRFSVYVVVAQTEGESLLYVGKTGDNRAGCNPLISRCGNHFSYNQIHSQIRNKIPNHELPRYTYVFDHFAEYCDDLAERRTRIDQINEMERWLNIEVQTAFASTPGVRLLNPYSGKNRSKAARESAFAFRTQQSQEKIRSIIEQVKSTLQVLSPARPNKGLQGTPSGGIVPDPSA